MTTMGVANNGYYNRLSQAGAGALNAGTAALNWVTSNGKSAITTAKDCGSVAIAKVATVAKLLFAKIGEQWSKHFPLVKERFASTFTSVKTQLSPKHFAVGAGIIAAGLALAALVTSCFKGKTAPMAGADSTTPADAPKSPVVAKTATPAEGAAPATDDSKSPVAAKAATDEVGGESETEEQTALPLAEMASSVEDLPESQQ